MVETIVSFSVVSFLEYCNLPITSSPVFAFFCSNSPAENAYACYSFTQFLQKSERNLVFHSLFALCNFTSSLNASLLFYVRSLPNKINFGYRPHPSLSQGGGKE